MSADYLDATLELGLALCDNFAPAWERAYLDGAGDALSADALWAPLDELWGDFLAGLARLPYSRAVLRAELGMEDVARSRSYAELHAWFVRWSAPLRRAWEQRDDLAEAADELRAMAARIERYYEWVATHRKFIERFLLP